MGEEKFFTKIKDRTPQVLGLKNRFFHGGLVLVVYLLAIALIFPLFVSTKNITPAQAASWYNYSWNNRQKITITNTGSELTNYQVLINDTQLDGTSVYQEANEDGSDLRFTQSDGTTLINHWIKSFSASGQSAEIWVKIPTIAASTTTDIFLYYDNADATSTSSGSNTFVFYDDFETYTSTAEMTTSNWTNASINGAFIAYSSNGGYSSTKGMVIDPHGGGGWQIPIAYSQSTISVNSVLEFDYKTADNNFYVGSRVGLSSASSCSGCSPDNGGVNYLSLEANNNFTSSSGGSKTTTAVSGFTITDWNNYKITYGSDSKFYVNNTLKATNLTNVPTVDLRIRFVIFPSGDDLSQRGYVDNVKVRQMAATEPTVTANGSEEIADTTAPTNPNVINGYDTSGKSANLVSSNWYSYAAPYFEFSGASDPESGVKGYWVYFGTAETADPYTAGTYQAHSGGAGATQNYTVSLSMSVGSTYYFRLRTQNSANGLADAQTYLIYKFDNVNPDSPEYVNVSPAGCSTSSTFTFTWPVGIDTGGSGIARYDYRLGSAGTVQTTAELAISAAPYQEGDNVFYVRSLDNAGNTSSWQTAVFCSTATVQVVDGPTVNAGPSSMTVRWTSNKKTTGYVRVYEGNTYISEQGLTDYSLSHEVKVVGLEPEKTYRYQLRWTDQSGNAGESNWYETTTSTAPSVKDFTPSALSPSQVLLSWKISELGTSKVEYGVNGFEKSQEISGLATSFTLEISGLTAGSSYQARIIARTQDGFPFYYTASFSTPPLPSIANLRFESVAGQVPAVVKVFWSTNVETSSSVFYGEKGSSKKEISTSDKIKDHQMEIGNLSDSTTYEVYAQGSDQFGNTAKSDVNTFTTPVDTTPPVISDITIETSNVGLDKQDKAQIAVSWKTNKPATSQVEYGTGLSGENYTNKTVEDKTLTDSHLVIITELTPSQPYHLKVVTTDKNGNTAKSDDHAAIPGEVPKSILQLILKTLQGAFGWLNKII